MEDNIITLWDWLAVTDDVEQADCIFLFGGDTMSIAEKGLELFTKQLAPVIIATGDTGTFGPHWGKPCADVFAEYLIKNGLPKQQIVIENKSTNTKEDVTFAISILEEKQISHQKILIVSRPVHQRRAYATCKKQQPSIQFINIPCQEQHPSQVDKDELLQIGKRCVQEYERIIMYGKSGDLEPQIIPAPVKLAAEALKKIV